MDDDALLSDALRAAAPPPPRGDRRTAILVAARYRRRHRRRALLAAACLAGVLALALALGGPGSDTDRSAGTGARVPGVGDGERSISIPGIAQQLRISATDGPLAAARSFGAIPLAGGAITGVSLTHRDDGSVVAIAAVTTGSGTYGIAVSTAGTSRAYGHISGGVALAVLPVPRWDPDLVLDVAALDRRGYTIESVRVVPSPQSAISCSAATRAGAPAGEDAKPTFVEERNAYLGAPLAPTCS
jgi:hypothetical protein